MFIADSTCTSTIIDSISLILSRNLIKALWCITQALGAGLNAAIALIELPLIYEFVLFTALMCVVIFVFVVINWNYKYKR